MALLFALLLLAAGQHATGRDRAAAYLRFATANAAVGLIAATVVGVPLLARRGTRALLVGLCGDNGGVPRRGAGRLPERRQGVAAGANGGRGWGVGVLLWGNYLCFALGGGAVRKIWDGQPHLHDRTSLRVTGEGVEFDAPLTRVLTRWPAVESWQATGRVFVLRLSRYSMLIVPRRAWPDPADAEAFASVLRDRAGRRDGLRGRAGGRRRPAGRASSRAGRRRRTRGRGGRRLIYSPTCPAPSPAWTRTSSRTGSTCTATS